MIKVWWVFPECSLHRSLLSSLRYQSSWLQKQTTANIIKQNKPKKEFIERPLEVGGIPKSKAGWRARVEGWHEPKRSQGPHEAHNFLPAGRVWPGHYWWGWTLSKLQWLDTNHFCLLVSCHRFFVSGEGEILQFICSEGMVLCPTSISHLGISLHIGRRRMVDTKQVNQKAMYCSLEPPTQYFFVLQMMTHLLSYEINFVGVQLAFWFNL